MDDLIKRADAIKWFEPYADRGLKIPVETVIQNLKDIPSAENKGEWEAKSRETYELPEGQIVVEYDASGIGLISRECMEMLVDTLATSKPNKGEWIPCSERLPEDLEIVNVTWVNHRPKGRYYAVIKDKPFTATAIHHRDRWWWYSPICEDSLAEYGESKCDKVNEDIEILAWMPLPEPWEGADDA